jgi:hypothetical protein
VVSTHTQTYVQMNMKNEQGTDTPIPLDEWLAKGSPQGQKVEMPLSHMVKDPEFQVRKRTNQQKMKQYAESMEAGCEFPPVQLGAVEGVLVLLDGWHRVGAKEILEEDSVVAVVSPMTYDQAKWAAAKANLHHGLSLTDTEVLDAFRAFVEAKAYRTGHTWLSYREIAQEIGRSHGTIRTWMERHFPKIFRKYQERASSPVAKEEWSGASGRKKKETNSLAKKVVQDAQAAMSNARKLGKTLDPRDLGSLIEALQETVAALKKLPHTKPSVDAF